ncbi:cupin domain-containing protein [Chamaesiphon sp. VAR_48_metabat_403]|uniref:cupin domain-containing protein n=1 Tax=Chamaesiphon sp. VAR_48_metabat_403 TaxID=2964700 RepID=UPI00286E8C85|nr:cupin domain-containing protein [Chamaesiphon sp. VAR_48_metabat_403]
MNFIDVSSALNEIDKLEITAQTTSEDAGAAMKMLARFNQCAMGLVCFCGSTPWERHPDDELLQILTGSVQITMLDRDKTSEITVSAGSILIVPQGIWHKQHSPAGVKLLFLTSQSGNEHSEAVDPRAS